MDSKKILNEAREIWGDDLQIDIAIEEMSELTKAVLKFRRIPSEYHRQLISEEIADVIVTIENLIDIYELDGDEILKMKEQKIKRLQSRIETHKIHANGF